MSTITVAALQPALAWCEPEHNCSIIREQTLRLIGEQLLDLIVLPEAFDGTPPELNLQATYDRTLDFIVELAQTTRAIVVGGSIAHRRPDGRVVNACPVADRTGRIVGEYLKRRLFGPELATRSAGEHVGIFEADRLRIGVLICSDLWHPELTRQLLDRVDLLCVPAKTAVENAAFVAYARTLWLSLALTRAVENVLPVLVSDWCEQTHTSGCTAGATSITDPAGRPDMSRVQQRLVDGREGTLVARIDLDAVERIRNYRRIAGLLPPTKEPQ